MIPQALAKEIKSKCQNKNEYLLAIRERQVRSTKGVSTQNGRDVVLNQVSSVDTDWVFAGFGNTASYV